MKNDFLGRSLTVMNDLTVRLIRNLGGPQGEGVLKEALEF